MEHPFIVLLQIARAFDSLKIKYVVVGSIASSIHGDYRATADIDIVAELQADGIKPLVELLKNDFYIDELAVRKAVARGRSFNAIHLSAIFKVDVFLPQNELAKQQLARRELHRLSPEHTQPVWIASAEDT